MGFWRRLFGGRADPAMRRQPTVGEWTIALPADFEPIDNGTSWQAIKGDRVLYVSALSVQKTPGRDSPALELHATCARALDGSAPGERLKFATRNVRGEAQVARTEHGWALTGFMVADGTVANCVINYARTSDRAWAIEAWKSLDHP